MKELSLNILDIAENSVKAGASLTEIKIEETETELTLTITDDGCGMSEETLLSVTNPFYTTRTTRSVGLGIPLLIMSAEQTGGSVKITSKKADDTDSSHGTEVIAHYYKNHLDFTPLGDVISTITTLIQGHPDTDFLFCHKKEGKEVILDTRSVKEILDDVPINTYEVIKWIEENLTEQYIDFQNKK
ncbi:MAG: sensor histidine kinase [Ruminococcaceae bacterium]|nr:sensor histidine kinase [Oscillospiraceae bacterium]